MSPTARPAPDLRHAHTTFAVVTALIALAAVACTSTAPIGKGPGGGSTAPTSGAAAASAPAASAAAAGTPTTTTTSTDAWLVTGRAGDDDLQVILASTSERFLGLPAGVPDRTWGQLVSVSRSGSATTVQELRIPEGTTNDQTVEGAWRLPTIGADPTPVGVSADRRTIVLVEDAAAPAAAAPAPAATATTRFAIVRRILDAKPRIIELPGAFDYDALSPDGSVLYVVEHLAGPPEGHYQVRAVDIATGRLREGIVVDKAQSDEAMAGWPIAQLSRPDGMVFTLYHGAEHPFIHALSSKDAWALCIDLPTGAGDDAAAASDWGLTATTDGSALIAANATLGLAVEIGSSDLAVRHSATFTPSAARGVVLAKFGHQAGGPVGRRVVASPVGSVVYAAGPGGIVAIGTSDLAVTGRFLEGVAVDAMAVTPDGDAIYALVHAGGRIVRLDPRTGRIAGEVPGGGFDRLVGVVPW